MDRLQQNGGTAGLVGGILLIVLGGLLFSVGLPPDQMGDPAKAIPVFGQKGGVITLIWILGAITTGLGILFAAGLAQRLRDRAPTRAAAQLYFVVIGLAALTLDGMVRGIGGRQLAATADTVAAGHAWVALNAVGLGISSLGNAFLGASLLLAGWAVATTGALPAAIGWVGVVGGVVTWLAIFTPASQAVLGLSFILPIVWLIWGGTALRRPAAG